MPWFDVFWTDSQANAVEVRECLRKAAGDSGRACVTLTDHEVNHRYLVLVSANDRAAAVNICASAIAVIKTAGLSWSFAKQAAHYLDGAAPAKPALARDLADDHPLRVVHCPVTLRDDKQTVVNSFGNVVCMAIGQREAAALVALINAGADHV